MKWLNFFNILVLRSDFLSRTLFSTSNEITKFNFIKKSFQMTILPLLQSFNKKQTMFSDQIDLSITFDQQIHLSNHNLLSITKKCLSLSLRIEYRWIFVYLLESHFHSLDIWLLQSLRMEDRSWSENCH